MLLNVWKLTCAVRNLIIIKKNVETKETFLKFIITLLHIFISKYLHTNSGIKIKATYKDTIRICFYKVHGLLCKRGLLTNFIRKHRRKKSTITMITLNTLHKGNRHAYHLTATLHVNYISSSQKTSLSYQQKFNFSSYGIHQILLKSMQINSYGLLRIRAGVPLTTKFLANECGHNPI